MKDLYCCNKQEFIDGYLTCYPFKAVICKNCREIFFVSNWFLEFVYEYFIAPFCTRFCFKFKDK